MKLDPEGFIFRRGTCGQKLQILQVSVISLRQRYDTHSNQFTLPSPKLSPSTVQRNSFILNETAFALPFANAKRFSFLNETALALLFGKTSAL